MLVPRGEVKAVLRGTLVGAAVGAPSLIHGASAFGAAGGGAALTVGELAVCLVQLGPVIHVMRHQGRMS